VVDILKAVAFVSLVSLGAIGLGAGLFWLIREIGFPQEHIGWSGYAVLGLFVATPLLFLILLVAAVLVGGFLEHLEEERQKDMES
jgi:hypothetical protein